MSHTLTRFYETVVFMFPGQAGSLVGVSREIYESEKGFRETVDVCCEDLRGEIGSDIREHLYPEEGRKHSAAPPIETMALKQPALFVTEYALAQLWIRWGVRPRAVIGHSVGEYVAACVAGVMSVKDALRLTAIRGRLFDELPEGAMLAVSLPEEEVRRQIAGDLSLAAINAPDQCVVAGEPAAVAAFEKKLNEKEIYCRRLPVNHAGHSRMTEPLLERFSQEVRKIKLNGPCLPYASNVTGGWVTADEITDAAYWVRHLREPVRFSSGLEQIMRETGRVALLEVGPGQVLSGLARLLRRRLGLHDEVRVIPSMRPSDQGLKTSSLLEALGKLRPAGIRSDDPDRSEPQWGGRQVPPRNEVEALVCETLEEILGVDKVSFHDDFFELGIDSLTVMRLVARLRKIFAKEVLPQTVFENCTAAALAQALTAFGVTAMETKGARPYGLGPGDSAPTSFGQRRLWFIHRLKGMSAEYNAVDTLRLRGELDRTILERAISAIAERHESLRTRFAEIDGEPVQIIDAHAPIRLPFEDLSAFDQISQQALIRKAARQAWQEPFDLASGPVWRLKLLKLSERDHVLLRAFHHIAFDEWSKNVFDYELLLLYGALRDNRVAALEPLPIQYVDYAIRQRARLSGESLKRRLDYWKTQLAGIPERLDLPKDRLRGIDETGQAGLCRLAITPFQVEALRKLGNANQATLYMTLLTALAVLLSRYCGQSDIVIGSPTAGRQDPQLEPLIGFFVNSLVMRINASSEQSFVELLRATRKTSLEAFLHQDLPFERLVEELSPQRSLSTSPVFQVAFVLHNTPQRFQRLESLEVEPLEIRRHWVNVDLEVHGYESNRGLELHWAYKRNLFDRRRMEQMTRHFARVLEVMVTDPGRLIRDLELTDSNEKHQLLSAANRMETARQRQDAPALFDLRSTSAPDAIALVFEDKQLSYLELNQRADQLARYLQRLGVGPEMSVGICLERSLEMVIGLLGVLKAGGAYVPLSPAYPKERLALMLEDAQALVLITQKGLAGNLPKRKSREICLDEDWGVIAQQNEESVISEVTLENLAYIIFTSGSTGRPKGVQVCRRGLCNLAEAQRKVFNVRAESRVLQFSSLSFDASIFEIVMALQHGATLCLGKQESLLSAQELIKLLRDQQITIVTLPPSVLETLPVENLPALETMIVAGEDCSAGLVTRWGRGRRFFNAYGPTETTVWAAVAECLNDGREPPIGRPIADTQIYLLDSHLQLAPAGVTGDLYIGGVGLARGYLNNPELTAEKFRPDPFSLQGGAHL